MLEDFLEHILISPEARDSCLKSFSSYRIIFRSDNECTYNSVFEIFEGLL